jgi:cold shock CspA family protein
VIEVHPVARKKKSTPTRAVVRAGSALPAGYASFLDGLKARIRAAQVKAALAVNAELVLLYWRIGRDILVRQEKEGWGASVIDRLSADLRAAFPEMQGFSPRNLKYMRAFAAAWADEAIVQAPLAQLTWYHNLTLLEKWPAPSIASAVTRAVLGQQARAPTHARAMLAVEEALPPQDGTDRMAEGVIKKLNDAGFGFIEIAGGGGKDLFFHRSGVDGVRFEDLHAGQRVSFTEGQGPKGPRAEKVKPM